MEIIAIIPAIMVTGFLQAAADVGRWAMINKCRQ